MKIVIMGCGRVGARVASILDHNGHDVTVIDTNPRAFLRLSADYSGDTIIGTGIDEDVLRAAGIEGADAFIAVTEGDNRNIMASQVAKEVFGVPEVITRIYDPVRNEIYRGLGLDTVCPTVIITETIRGELAARLGQAGSRQSSVAGGQ